MKVEADDGRIYLPKDTRERHGDRYRLIEMDDGILLVPVSEDPLQRLREITSDTEKSSDKLVEEARRSIAEDEKDVRGH